jgi:hypothetical protein
MNRITPANRHSVRGTAEHVTGAQIRYTWPCGHTETVDHSKAPVPVVKRFGEWAAKFYVKYWSGSGGVILPECKTCARAERKREMNAKQPHAFVQDKQDAPRVRSGQEDVDHCATCGQAEDRPIHRV